MQRSPKRIVSHVRQMPKIYGNLQREKWHFPLKSVLLWLRNLLILGALGMLIYILFFSSLFQVNTVEVQGAVLTSPDALRQTVALGSNIWRVPQHQIAATLEQNPIIEQAVVSKGLPHTIRISVMEKKPVLIWVTQGTSWLVDDTGEAFLSYDAATFPGPTTPQGKLLATIPTLQDTTNLPVKTNQFITSPLLTQFIQTIETKLPQALPELPIDHFELAGATYDLIVVTKPGMRIQMSGTSDPAVQIRNLTRLVHTENVPLTAQVNLLIPRWAYVK